jgi:hypothetical protein
MAGSLAASRLGESLRVHDRGGISRTQPASARPEVRLCLFPPKRRH